MNQYTAPWSEEKINLLKKLWEEKASCRAIGRELGVSHNSVASKVRQLELPMRRASSSTKLGSGRPVAATGKRQNQLSAIRPPRSNFNPTFSFDKKSIPQTPYPPRPTDDQKEYILGQGVPLNDSVMEIVGQGKQASIRWSGGLQPGQCKWVINEQQRGGEYLFCGAKALSGCVYCAEHERRATG